MLQTIPSALDFDNRSLTVRQKLSSLFLGNYLAPSTLYESVQERTVYSGYSSSKRNMADESSFFFPTRGYKVTVEPVAGYQSYHDSDFSEVSYTYLYTSLTKQCILFCIVV